MKNILSVVSLFLILSLGGCNGVPSEYKGDFQDARQGATLTVKGTQWIFQARHHSLKGSVAEASFDKLQKGKPGIFVRPYPERKDLVEIFWLNPRLDSRREGGGLAWMEAEVAYAVLQADVKEKVQAFDLVYSDRGVVTLDPSAKEWQVGWAPGAEEFHFVRVQKDGGGSLFPALNLAVNVNE